MLVLRWFLDATRVAQLAADNQLSASTTYRYLHEAIDVLAAAAPTLHGALLAGRVTVPDGWPLWTSPVRPGREHDTTCARTHPGLLDVLTDWTDDTHAVLADRGYEGENTRLTCPIKNTRGTALTTEQRIGVITAAALVLLHHAARQ